LRPIDTVGNDTANRLSKFCNVERTNTVSSDYKSYRVSLIRLRLGRSALDLSATSGSKILGDEARNFIAHGGKLV